MDIDRALSKIILLAFANNHFFICVQLCKSLKWFAQFELILSRSIIWITLFHICRPLPSAVQFTYFWWSLLFLIGRTVAVSLYAAQIHEESKKPIKMLRALPRSVWCSEAHRFADEVVNDTVALSGMRFFFITRKMLLAVSLIKKIFFSIYWDFPIRKFVFF